MLTHIARPPKTVSFIRSLVVLLRPVGVGLARVLCRGFHLVMDKCKASGSLYLLGLKCGHAVFAGGGIS
jgi:hypothetical protein